MSHHSRLLRWLTLVIAAATLATAAHAAPRNILLLIADDFGIDSAEFYPTTIRRVTTPSAPPMPNLKRLARSGVLFRTAWANPICAPSRATIFTGRYSFRTGVGANPHDDPEFAELSQDEFILPEAFRARSGLGYVLAHIGKWHVSRGATDPNRLGWPYFAGGAPGAPGVPGYFSWTKYINNTSTTSTTYATTDQVNEALGVIRRARKQGRPYFIEVAFNAPHSPFHKPPNALHSRDALPKYKPGVDRRPYYEAMVEALDTEIGRLLQGVNLATTTVIFVGDNGTRGEVIAQPYPESKGKGTPYESGIRVPLLVAGAGVANPGRVVKQLVNTVDLYPTVLELAGIDPTTVLPSGIRIDGVSLLPYLRNVAHPGPRKWAYAEEFWRTTFRRAIRNARYKLIERSDTVPEFYDLDVDPLEAGNLLVGTLTSTQRTNFDSLNQQLGALLASH